jgi:hypothetical protein
MTDALTPRRDDLEMELRVVARMAAKNGAPDAAAFLEAMLAPHSTAAALRLRRTALRAIWRAGFFGLPRTAAAKAIAGAWRAYSLRLAAPRPEIADHLAMLERAGVAPLSWRTIADDLDADLDPHRER